MQVSASELRWNLNLNLAKPRAWPRLRRESSEEFNLEPWLSKTWGPIGGQFQELERVINITVNFTLRWAQIYILNLLGSFVIILFSLYFILFRNNLNDRSRYYSFHWNYFTLVHFNSLSFVYHIASSFLFFNNFFNCPFVLLFYFIFLSRMSRSF